MAIGVRTSWFLQQEPRHSKKQNWRTCDWGNDEHGGGGGGDGGGVGFCVFSAITRCLFTVTSQLE